MGTGGGRRGEEELSKRSTSTAAAAAASAILSSSRYHRQNGDGSGGDDRRRRAPSPSPAPHHMLPSARRRDRTNISGQQSWRRRRVAGRSKKRMLSPLPRIRPLASLLLVLVLLLGGGILVGYRALHLHLGKGTDGRLRQGLDQHHRRSAHNQFPPPYPKVTKRSYAGKSSPGTSLSREALDMCTNALWHTVETTTVVLPDGESFVHTGDIDDLWLRDSAAQVHPLLVPFGGRSAGGGDDHQALIADDPRLDRIVAGLIRRCAMYIRHGKSFSRRLFFFFLRAPVVAGIRCWSIIMILVFLMLLSSSVRTLLRPFSVPHCCPDRTRWTGPRISSTLPRVQTPTRTPSGSTTPTSSTPTRRRWDDTTSSARGTSK